MIDKPSFQLGNLLFFFVLVQNITKVSVSGRPPAIITGILWQLNFIIEWLQSYALYTGAHDIICINFDFQPSSWGCFYHQHCSCCSFGVSFSHSMSSRLLCCLVWSSSRTSHCGTVRSKRAVEMKSEMMLSGKQRYRESVHLGALLSCARHQAVRNGGKRQEMNWDARTHSICKVMISLALISNLWMLFCCTRSCVRLRPELPSVDPQPRGQTGSETG